MGSPNGDSMFDLFIIPTPTEASMTRRGHHLSHSVHKPESSRAVTPLASTSMTTGVTGAFLGVVPVVPTIVL